MRLLAFTLGCCLLALAGCKTPSPTGSSWLASVLIPDKTTSQVRVVATTIFEREGFKVQGLTGDEIILEKPGSTMNNVIYGDLSSGVWIRVKLRIRTQGPDARLLECNAYRVADRGDRVFERETSYKRSGSFQKLLDEIKAQLQTGAAPPGATNAPAPDRG